MYFGFSSNMEKINVLETTEFVVLCCFSYNLNKCIQNVKEYLTLDFWERLIIWACHSYSPLSWRGQKRGFGFEDFLFVSWKAVELMAPHPTQFHVVQNKTSSVFSQIPPSHFFKSRSSGVLQSQSYDNLMLSVDVPPGLLVCSSFLNIPSEAV